VSSAETVRSGAGRRKIGVVLVHGVGEGEPGYSIMTLLSKLRDHGYQDDGYSWVKRETDFDPRPPKKDRPARTFPVYLHCTKHKDGQKITFAELHWADLTNLKPGRINGFLGLLRVIFESHHLVNAMLRRGADWATAVLRWMMWIASFLMRGPLAALAIATSAVCALLVFGPVGWPVGWTFHDKFLVVQAGLLILAVAAILWFVWWLKDITWYDTAFWVMVVSGALLVMEANSFPVPEAVRYVPLLEKYCYEEAMQGATFFVAPDLRESLERACYVNGPYRVIALGWRIWGILICSAIVVFLVICSRASRSKDINLIIRSATSIGLVVLQFMLWTTLIVSIIFTMLSRAETYAGLSLAKARFNQVIETSTQSPVQSFLERPEIRTILELPQVQKMLNFPEVQLPWIGPFKFVFAAVVMSLLLFAIVGVIVITVRWLMVKWSKSDLDGLADRLPRLVFNRYLLLTLLSCGFLIIFWIIWIPELSGEGGGIWGEAKRRLLDYSWVAALLIPALLLGRVANGVHIARDLIDHHYSPRIESAHWFLPWLFPAKPEFPRREHIKFRLARLMNGLAAQGPFDSLIFVAHSHGSAVVYDYVKGGAPGLERLGCGKPSLVTLGSPIGDLYQRYFREYSGFLSPVAEFRDRLRHWTNLYRVDDYVGGRIPVTVAARVENIALKRGGHMDYWREPRVVEAVDAMIKRHLDAPQTPSGDGQGRGITAA